MKRIVFLLVSLLFIKGAEIHAQQLYQLSVKEAVDLAYKNVIELKNAKLDLRIQEAQNKEITGQALPQISGAINANRYLELPKFLFPDASQAGIYAVLIKEGLLPNSTPIPTPIFQQVSFQQPWNLTAGATVTQLLFQPDVFVGLKARQASVNINKAAIEQTMAKIKDSAYKHYYAILVAQKQLYFFNENIKQLEKFYHDDSIMYQNGFAEKLDVDKIQVQLNNSRTAQSFLSSGLVIAYALLKFSLGISQKDSVMLKDDLNQDSIKEDVLDEAFAYNNRPEIRILNYTKQLQQLNVKRYQLEGLPTISLAGNYSVTAMGQKFYTNPSTVWLRSSYVGLNINVPIFTGFQRKYKVVETQLGLEKVENNIENVKQAIDFEQVATRESMKNALANLDMQQRNIELAQKVFNTTRLKYEQGMGSSFEVLQANTDFQTAQSNYFNALYNAAIAKISYLYSLGKL